MSRLFTRASSEDITLALGALNFAFGPGTIAVLLRVGSLGATGTPFAAGSNTVGYNLSIRTSGVLRLTCDAGTSDGTTALVTANWYLIAVTKATGTVAPRMHIYRYSTGVWVHENGATSIANSSTPAVVPRIGSLNGANYHDGDIAAAGVWNVVLTDTQIESLAAALMPWFQIQPRGLWVLDQGVINTASTYSQTVMVDSPRGYWRLGEGSGNFADSSGLGHTATPSGGVTYGVDGAIGDASAAITLNGTTGYATVTDHADLDLGDVVTLELWVKPQASSGLIVLMDKGTGAYQPSLNANSPEWWVSNTGLLVNATTPVPVDGAWHHLVFTKNGPIAKIYLDGVDITGTGTNTVMVNTATDLYIGRWGGGGYFYSGSIDEVAVYPTALSAARVLIHYQARACLVGMSLNDLAGSGANQTALTGTAVSPNSVPVWTPGQ